MTSKLLQITKFIDVHTHSLGSDTRHVTIYSYTPMVDKIPLPLITFSTGIHPWGLKHQEIEAQWREVKRLAGSTSCLIIGESGLDKTIEVDLKFQELVFLRHIKLSILLQKPLIIHCVKALQEVLFLKRNFNSSPPWIIHDFNGNDNMIAACLKYNIYFSLGPRFFNSRKSKIAQSLKQIPTSRLFFETDDQGEFPIERIYQEYADRTELKLAPLKEAIEENYKKVILQTPLSRIN